MNTVHLDKILVVDDSTANLHLLCNLLEKHGYNVYPASDGELALEFVRSILPHLILLDIRMPEMDGFEVCRRLKNDKRTHAIPVIFVSILENENEKIKAFEAGAVDYITKPFQAEEVLARVRIHMRLRELNEYLEQMVAERTRALQTANDQLQHELIERKKAEEKIQQMNRELDRRVQDRTTKLEALNKELEAFAYSVSHDLRAPLRHIDGFVELLVSRYRERLDEKGIHYVDAIAGSVRQMGVLIDDLLQFSRTGRVEVHQGNVNMNQALAEVVAQLKESYADRTIEWIIGDLPIVRGDYALLRQVWSNLVENAVKYTRQREVARIEVGVRRENDEILFYITDNGIGFDMQYAGKLFGVFQRLHSMDEFEGTGIGLAIVHRIITRHGGRVWAEARTDEGATFYFALSAEDGNLYEVHRNTDRLQERR